MPQLADHYVAFGNKIGHQPPWDMHKQLFIK